MEGTIQAFHSTIYSSPNDKDSHCIDIHFQRKLVNLADDELGPRPITALVELTAQNPSSSISNLHSGRSASPWHGNPREPAPETVGTRRNSTLGERIQNNSLTPLGTKTRSGQIRLDGTRQ